MFEDNYLAANPDFTDHHLLIVLSGCSGAGKSSLLTELVSRGFEVQPEAGRQIVKEQLRVGGDALPWLNDAKFTDLLISRATLQFNVATLKGKTVVFDRSIIDSLAYLEHMKRDVPSYLLNAVELYRYAKRVFLLPPWEEIFTNDAERKHSFADARAQYDSLIKTYQRLGYETLEIPKMSVPERVDFFQEHSAKKNLK